MKNVEISRQKAVSIIKKSFIKDGTLGSIDEAMYGVIQPYKMLKNGKEVLLRTGAKLKMYDKKYYICGYHHSGDDVDYYFKKMKYEDYRSKIRK